jgi:hypothetical protein
MGENKATQKTRAVITEESFESGVDSSWRLFEVGERFVVSCNHFFS